MSKTVSPTTRTKKQDTLDTSKKAGFFSSFFSVFATLAGARLEEWDPDNLEIRDIVNNKLRSVTVESHTHPVQRTILQLDPDTKQNRLVNYDSFFLTDGRYTAVPIYVKPYDQQSKRRENPSFFWAMSEDADFIKRAYFGSQEERSSITAEQHAQKVQIVVTNHEHDLRKKFGGKTLETFNMGNFLNHAEIAFQQIAERYASTYLPIEDGADILRSDKLITWREKNENSRMQQLANLWRTKIRNKDPIKPEEGYNAYVYHNPFGQSSLRLRQQDLEKRWVRWVMRRVSVNLNKHEDASKPLLNEQDSRAIMQRAFTKASRAIEKYSPVYAAFKPKKPNSDNLKFSQKLKHSLRGLNHGLKNIAKGIQGPVNFLVNRDRQKATLLLVMSAGMAAVTTLGGILFTATAALPTTLGGLTLSGFVAAVSGSASTLLKAGTITATLKNAGQGISKNISRFFSELRGIAYDVYRDRSINIIVNNKYPTGRQRDQLSGLTLNDLFRDYTTPLPYMFFQDERPDAYPMSAEEYKENANALLRDPHSANMGSSIRREEIDGFPSIAITDHQAGIKTLHPVEGRTVICERLPETSIQDTDMEMIKGPVKEMLAHYPNETRFVVPPIKRHKPAIEQNNEQHCETDDYGVSPLAGDNALTTHDLGINVSGRRNFEEMMGCTLDDIADAEAKTTFNDISFMSRKTHNAMVKQLDLPPLPGTIGKIFGAKDPITRDPEDLRHRLIVQFEDYSTMQDKERQQRRTRNGFVTSPLALWLDLK